MTVESGKEELYFIDGKEVRRDGYHTTITKDALIQFATTTKEFFLSDEDAEKDFIEYMDLMNELQGTMVMMANPYAPDRRRDHDRSCGKKLKRAFDAVIEELKDSMGDLTMDVYVRKDGKMAGFDYETTAVIAEENIKLYGNVAFAGGYSMMSNVKAVLNVESADGEVVTASVDKTGTYEKDKTWAGTLERNNRKRNGFLQLRLYR